MSPKSNSLYSVQGHQGAHVLLAVRHTESGDIADVQLIGAPLPFSAPVGECKPFERADQMPNEPGLDRITLLAQEAVLVYGLEPGRVQRGADLVRNPYNVQSARRDELEQDLQPSLKVLAVRGSEGWYVVRPNFCQCIDHSRGNVCKHRIAGWIHRESIVRPLAQVRKVERARIIAELMA